MCLQGMVCVQEEGKISFTVQNASTDLQNAARAVKVDVAPGMTVQEVMRDVGRKFHYEPDSFEIVLQNHEHPEVSGINLSEHLDETVEAVEFDLQHPERSKLVLTNLGVKQGSVEKPPRKVTGTSEGSEDDMLLGASASPDYMSTSTHPPAAITSGSGSIGYSSCSNSFMRHDTGFVGLVNQAMTCYLNSLLQALYMTPEFRNALYKWEFDGSEQEEIKSIPYQLQKLFLNLQTSTKSAVETTELTRSFGWDSSEAWQQHDIQELCRVMFDALEHKFKNTKQSDLILRLYEEHALESQPSSSSFWAEFDNLASSQHPAVNQEVDGYLRCPTISRSSCALIWWKETGQLVFPKLAALARQYLGIPATEASSERVFSCAGNIVTAHREKLTTNHVEELIFLHQNRKEL